MSIFSWGSNAHGQLGVSTDGALAKLRPQKGAVVAKPHLVEGLEARDVIAVAGGLKHSAAVTSHGDVYVWGRGDHGQLGLGKERTRADQPVRLDALHDETIVCVAAGADFSLAATASGRCYWWGLLFEHEELRDEDSVVHTRLPTLAADLQHNSFLRRLVLNSTAAYLAGRKRRNRLRGGGGAGGAGADGAPSEGDDSGSGGGAGGGGGGEDWRDDPDAVDEVEAALDAEAEAEAEELASSGMLRMKLQRRSVARPELVGGLMHARVRQCVAGHGHALVVTEAGTVFAAGYNDRGQLGTGSRLASPYFVPVQNMAGLHIADAACGQQHNLARTADTGRVFAWGSGALGQLGLGFGAGDCLRPAEVTALTAIAGRTGGVRQVACGLNHSIALCADGRVFAWGHSEYGQMGTLDEGGLDLTVPARHYYVPREVRALRGKGITRVTCGSLFSLATGDAGVLSWGWDAHGVLGRDGDRSLRDFEPLPFFEGLDVSAVEAGQSHAMALVVPPGHAFALNWRPMTADLPGGLYSRFMDCAIVCLPALQARKARPGGGSTAEAEGEGGAGDEAEASEEEDDWPDVAADSSAGIHCHRIVLSARCAALREALAAADSEAPSDAGGRTHRLVAVRPAQGTADREAATAAAAPAGTGAGGRLWQRTLVGLRGVRPRVLAALVEYLYTDALRVPPHRRAEVRDLGRELGLPHLSALAERLIGRGDTMRSAAAASAAAAAAAAAALRAAAPIRAAAVLPTAGAAAEAAAAAATLSGAQEAVASTAAAAAAAAPSTGGQAESKTSEATTADASEDGVAGDDGAAAAASSPVALEHVPVSLSLELGADDTSRDGEAAVADAAAAAPAIVSGGGVDGGDTPGYYLYSPTVEAAVAEAAAAGPAPPLGPLPPPEHAPHGSSTSHSAAAASGSASASASATAASTATGAALPPSSFPADMRAGFLRGDYADVVFSLPRDVDTEASDGAAAAGGAADRVLVPAHRAVLCRYEYFASLFAGGFREAASMAMAEAPASPAATAGGAGGAGGGGAVEAAASPPTIEIDDVPGPLFSRMLEWAYSGDKQLAADPDDALSLVTIAARFSLHDLATVCESTLREHVDEDNAGVCYDIASAYDVPRLMRHSADILRRKSAAIAHTAAAQAAASAAMRGGGLGGAAAAAAAARRGGAAGGGE